MGKNSNIKKLILGGVILIIIILVSIKLYYNHAINHPLSTNPTKEEFVIKQGSSVTEILNQLENQGYITAKQKLLMKIYIKLNNLGRSIEAGTYFIPHNLTIKELTQTIQNGKYKSIWITIPSGIRADEVCQKIDEQLNNINSNYDKETCMTLIDDQYFIKSLDLPFNQEIQNLEGLLYPDKYLVPQDASTEDILKILIDQFKKNIPKNFSYSDLIIASLLEKEGIDYEDKQIISGIIRKRINEGWLIQIDATILYYKKDWSHVITQEDLEEDEPYNTYTNLNLPPTPICNVTKEDLDASINYIETEYYYYIHDNNQNPHYSRNAYEHQNNINKYLR